MVIKGASKVVEEPRKKIFDGADASGDFTFGELLIRCRVAGLHKSSV